HEKDINLYINSPGGVVSAGVAIYDTMQYDSCDVATTWVGMAASMGAGLLAGGSAGKRNSLPTARVIIHQPLGGIPAKDSDLEIKAQEILRIKNLLMTILSEHSGHDADRVTEDADRNKWMSAEEAKEYGLVDNIMESKKHEDE